MRMEKWLDRRRWWRRPSAYSDVQVELIQTMFRGLIPTVLVGTASLVGMTAVLAKHYGDPFLWTIAAVMLLICSLRLGCVIAFCRRRSAELTITAALKWRRFYGMFTYLYCLSLAYATVYAGYHLDATAWALCTMGTFALCAGIGARSGMRPWITHACCFTMLVGLCLAFVPRGGLLGGSSCVLVAAFAVSHYYSTQVKFEILVEQLRSRRKLRELAEHDTLTGLSNRRCFEASLKTAFQQRCPIAVLFIDLDGFKGVNDSFGHATGDALLQQVAGRLSGAVRGSDLVARLGGDEFAILHGAVATEETACLLAERINLAIGLPFQVSEQLILIGASVGIRLSNGREISADTLLRDADRALYRVKQAGGKSFSFANRLLKHDPA